MNSEFYNDEEEDFYNDEGEEDYDYDNKTYIDNEFTCCEQGYTE